LSTSNRPKDHDDDDDNDDNEEEEEEEYGLVPVFIFSL